MTSGVSVRLVPLSLLAGVATAVAAVAVHQWWWGLLLAAATTLAVLLTTPRGWATRLPFGLAFVGVVGLLSIGRGEGDYLIGSTVNGYAVLGLALVVMTLSIATLPRPGRRNPRPTGDSARSE